MKCAPTWAANAVNELIDEFDLELMYNIAPMESDYSNS